ncbi:unnamed protein product [Orchesella dallaii]|uniref:F-box domain-containing protein n=1 Tax=Orchesella dallaii TaxID=48710 RepID=A0ABP1RU29_9HEXA
MFTRAKSQRIAKMAAARALEENRNQGFECCNQNPMLNTVVLTNLFRLIPFNLKDFKNFRLVCKQWKELCNPHFRHNVWIELYGHKDLVFNDDNTYTSMLSQPGGILQTIKDNSRILHQFLDQDLTFQNYAVSICVQDSLLGDMFWHQFAPTMTHLELFCSHIYVNDVRRIIFEMTPNLKFLSLRSNLFIIPRGSSNQGSVWEWDDEFTLTPASRINKNLTVLKIEDFGHNGEFPIVWKEFVIYYPNLKALNLQLCNWHAQLSFLSLKYLLHVVNNERSHYGQHHIAELESLDIIRHEPGSPQLAPDWEVLDLMRVVAFPLTKLAMDVDWEENAEMVFKEVLEIYSTTLQKLTVCRSDLSYPFQEELTDGLDLKQLTELTLVGTICQNLHFLGELPQLKKLVMMDTLAMQQVECERSVKNWCEMSSQQGSSASTMRVIGNTNFSGREMRGKVLYELETFMFGTEVCNGRRVKALAKLMPNVKTLQLGMGNGGFQILCRQWKCLEHLTIAPMDVNEQGLLGIKKKVRYCAPNLTDLRGLKTFSVGSTSSDPGGMRVNLSNDSIVYGVLALQNLEDLVVGVVAEMCDELKSALTCRFPGMRSE